VWKPLQHNGEFHTHTSLVLLQYTSQGGGLLAGFFFFSFFSLAFFPLEGDEKIKNLSEVQD